MNGFDYFQTNKSSGRARCQCPVNDLADVNEAIKKKDPSKKPEANGWIQWTREDSKKTGIQYRDLYEAYLRLKSYSNLCDTQGGHPGCNYTMEAGWSLDQKERILAQLEKRDPNLKRWNFSPQASENLKKMGVRVSSPYGIDRSLYPTNSPKQIYQQVPKSNRITLTTKKNTLLRIPVDQGSFVNITGGRDGTSGNFTNVEVLVHHSTGLVSFYRIKEGQVIAQQKNVDLAMLHR